MHRRLISQKETEFVTLALSHGKANRTLIHAWYRGLGKLKRDLTPNSDLLSEYPN